MATDDLHEAVQFFRADEGYTRLFAEVIDKYRSLGRFGGTVVLEDMTSREQEVLSALLRRDYSDRQRVTVAVSDVIAALGKTRFAHIDPKALLDGYAGGFILAKAEEQALYEREKEQFFKDLANEFTHIYCQIWLEDIVSKAPGTRGVHLAYDKDQKLLRGQLQNVLRAIGHLPSNPREGALSAKYERVPVFASRIAGHPHAFDLDTDSGRFLVGALQAVRARIDASYVVEASPSAEAITELLDEFGLVRDDLLNFVTCTGILGFSSKGHGPLPLWQAAYATGSVLNVPLREMVKVDKCLPGAGWEQAREQPMAAVCPIFVIENSGVFSAILDAFTGVTVLPPLVCTHGQFNLATLMLLDKLADNSILFYSGDFDPEGLQMAERLMERYPGALRPWRYTVLDYETVMSHVGIPPYRLRMLERIESPELLPVAKSLEKHGKAGYQEELLDNLVRDIKAAQLWAV
ncbi:MAG: TIGR02679 family protein [Firmicutes bacterium]|nr:TIGR02679 family protein [Bacillota bacterium]